MGRINRRLSNPQCLCGMCKNYDARTPSTKELKEIIVELMQDTAIGTLKGVDCDKRKGTSQAQNGDRRREIPNMQKIKCPSLKDQRETKLDEDCCKFPRCQRNPL